MYDVATTWNQYDNNVPMQAQNQVANPFGGNMIQANKVGTAQAVSHELAEMQAQIYLAKQFPRDQMKSTERILTACQRPGLASVAVYSYAKGGTSVSGPSIRLAEEIARDWGNLECGWNELEREDDMSKVRAFAWDKETNVLKTLFFYVPHYRTTRQGRKRLTDEREIYELLANQAARRMRNCILALIPGDVVDAAVEQCERTMVTHCEITPDSIKKLIEAFEPFGVTKKQIEKRIQRNIESITPAQFVRMREIFTSLRDGVSDASDWFEISENEDDKANANSGTQAVKEALKNSAKRTPKQHKSKPTSGGLLIDSVAEVSTDEEQTLSEILRSKILNATSTDELASVAENLVGNETLKESERDELYKLIDERSQTLE